MKKYNLFLLLALCMIIFISCQKEEIDSIVEDVYSKDFYSFSNEKEFNDIFSNEVNLSEFEFSFVTQFDIFQRAMLEDEKYQSYLEGLSAEELHIIKSQKGNLFPFSEFALANKNLFVFDDRTGHYSYDLAVAQYEPAVVYFLNKDGIIQIGDSIRRYTSRGIITAHISKLNEVLDIDNSIFAGKNLTIKEYNLGRIQGGDGIWTCDNTTSDGKKKIEGKAVTSFIPNFRYTGQTGSGAWYAKVSAYFKATNYKKNLFGWSKKRSTSTAIWGFDISFYLGIGGAPGQGSVSIPSFWHSEGDAQEITYNVYRINEVPWLSYPDIIMRLNYDEVVFRGGGNVTCDIMNP